jgi:hypothetical protein
MALWIPGSLMPRSARHTRPGMTIVIGRCHESI